MYVIPSLKKLVVISFSLNVIILMSACSDFKNLGNQQQIQNKKDTLDKQVFEHEHPTNPCTEALAHSHKHDVNETKLHEHRYDCENSNPVISNAHIHEPREGVRRYRHIHPNGANEHSH